tara:strand:+ start:1624 stop:2412 length:789 start_codon:yes stop_codon:yes gene_type:complete
MAKISETELQRRLKALERGKGGSGGSYSGTTAPVDDGGTYVDNDTYYDSATNNLYVFSGNSWVLASKQLHVRYATLVVNVSSYGTVTNQIDVTGFSELPFDSAGIQKDWRGFWWGPSNIGSTDPTDYEWTLTSGVNGSGAVAVNIYSTNGTVFRNDTGVTVLRANVDIGGTLQDNTEHATYDYNWTVGSDTVCVDALGNVASDGLGNIYTDTVAVSCQVRGPYHRADSTNSTTAIDFREITLSADDIGMAETIRVSVSNIPD